MTTTRRALAAVTALALAGAALTGCAGIPLAAAGPRVTEQHEISPEVHALRLETAGDVIVRLGDEPGLSIRGRQAVLDRLTVEEEDGVLVLGARGPSWSVNRVEYVLTVPVFDAVELEGAGDVRADFSAADAVSIRIDGAGDVRGTGIDAAEVSVEIAGAGDVQLDGTAESASFEVSGTGDIRAGRLVVADALAAVSGAGDVTVRARDTLDARISGVGDIRVLGDPRVTREVSGLGEIRAG